MLQPEDMQIVIMSRKRVESCARAHALVPSAVVCVAESEVEDYKPLGVPLVAHPDSVDSVPRKGHWILNHFPHKCVVLFDDDIKALYCLVGKRARKITDPDVIWRVIFNTALLTEEMGISLFGYAMTADIRKLFPYAPFNLTKVAGPCWGFIGRRIQFDPTMTLYGDLDVNFSALLHDRFVFQDQRYAFDAEMQVNTGGATHMRTADHVERNQAILRRKWGPSGVNWKTVGSQGMTRVINIVKRRASIKS